MTTMRMLGLAILAAAAASCAPKSEPPRPDPVKPEMTRPVETPKPEAPKPKAPEDKSVPNPLGLSDDEWKKKLTPEEYKVCRQQGTERPGTGKLLHYKGTGTFVCVACDNPLFEPKAKFESGTGWPSFFKPIEKKSVLERGDFTHGMSRIEVNCAKCGSHLGHVFEDGPEPTGLRYCMNSVSMKIREKDEPAKEEKK
jgi:peptide-methionine (R)-S-oxide reductase